MEDKGGWSPSPSSREEQTSTSDNNGHRRDLLEGLLLVETGIDEDETVDIYAIRMGRMVLVESGGEVFARAWLGKHAQRLVEWQPRRRHDDLSGIWYRPAQERSLRVKEAPRKECMKWTRLTLCHAEWLHKRKEDLDVIPRFNP